MATPTAFAPQQQLRLREPQPAARLITGVKRDIALLDRLGATTKSRITVLDISLDRNRTALEHLLTRGNRIFYADHHYSGPIPVSEALEAHIDPSLPVCTSYRRPSVVGGISSLGHRGSLW